MRPDGPINADDLTEAQKMMARVAGIPADRPGLGAEYPKMVYRPGKNPRHMLLNQPLKIDGKHECETALVDCAADEAEALSNGWFLSPDPAEQAKYIEHQKAERAKDNRIAELEALVAAQSTTAATEKRGPGRPPKSLTEAHI